MYMYTLCFMKIICKTDNRQSLVFKKCLNAVSLDIFDNHLYKIDGISLKFCVVNE